MSRARVAVVALMATLLLSDGPAAQSAEGAPVAPGAIATEAETRTRIQAYLSDQNPLLTERQVDRIVGSVMRCSESYELDPYLVAGVLDTESTARPWAISPKGAVGLMQIMPYMYELFDLPGNITSIETNIEAGCLILSDNIRRLGENEGILSYFWGSQIRGVSYLHRVREARAALQAPPESRS